MRRNLRILAVCISVCCAGAASAATVTDTVSFSVDGPFSAPLGGTPTSPVTGSFTITIDPTLTYTDTVAGITLNNLNIALDSALAFDYDATTHRLNVGGISSGSEIVTFGTNDFYLHIENFLTAGTDIEQLGYTNSSGNYFFTPTPGGTVAVGPAVVAVPGPIAGAGLIPLVGLAGAWVAKRRKRLAA